VWDPAEAVGPWSALAGVQVHGYEIHHGRTEALTNDLSATPTWPVLHDALGQPLGWRRGSVLGLYLHGLFEDDAVMRALFGADAPSLDRVMDGLADFIDLHLGPATLSGLLEPA
jgi:adenosylcobyric acid synthase